MAVLHPRHKLTYFKNAGWEADWIKTAESIVHKTFKQSYEKAETKPDVDETVPAAKEKPKNMFNELEALAAPKASDLRSEIDRYLSTDVEDVRDAVMWWTERKSMFLILSRMALDYLSIPGECSHHRHFPLVSQRFPATSVDVEQVFSRGRLVLSHT